MCEPHGTGEAFDAAMKEYYGAIAQGRGAIFFAICRGKVNSGTPMLMPIGHMLHYHLLCHLQRRGGQRELQSLMLMPSGARCIATLCHGPRPYLDPTLAVCRLGLLHRMRHMSTKIVVTSQCDATGNLQQAE